MEEHIEEEKEGREDIELFFDISNLVKDFYETPVVFITRNDYSAFAFSCLCSMREAIKNDDTKQVIEIIADFHLKWLNIVNEIENFTALLETSENIRRKLEQCTIFTTDAVRFRLRNYHKYVEENMDILDANDQANLQSELELVEEMHTEVTHVLGKKLDNILNCKTDLECKVKANDAAEELLKWIDTISDVVVTKISKYVHPETDENTVTKLTKVLQQIVDEIAKAHKEAEDPQAIGQMVCTVTAHELQRNKLFDKITTLNDRIKRLEAMDKGEPSAALLAIRNKKVFLQRKLNSLENIKTTLQKMNQSIPVINLDKECVCEDYYSLRIFNHALPLDKRERLVTELCHVWDTVIFGDNTDRSMISILSAVDLKEEFNDELGTFFIDEYSRKIYKLPDTDVLYQPNENGQLVPISDDGEHIYFYDDCGRYYVHPVTRNRIYKAHETASEYIMDSSGVLLKVKEVVDGIEFCYDSFGRYYVDRNGKHIYRNVDATSEYENDGFGNLVRIRSHMDLFDPCPLDANVTEDFRYLKESVGKALRECLGKVLLYRPSDPIKYLSSALVKYRENLELRDKNARETEELNAERELVAAEERAAAERAAMEAALLAQGGSEASYDSNLFKYNPSSSEDASGIPSAK